MIDTHAHLDALDYDNDRQEVIDRAFDEGIEYILIPAIEPTTYDNIFQLVESNSKIYCSMGIHPHNAKGVTDNELQIVEANCKHKKTLAIGEIGLDYYYDFATPDEQKSIFISQLKIAKENKLPVIIHNRLADDDILNILKNEQDGSLRGVLHCFSSSVDILHEVLDLGFHVSFTGNITFKKSTLSDVVLEVPIDRIMLETDSPYMTPVPLRGRRNEPSNVKYVANKISEIKSISIEEVIKMTTKNAKQLFNFALLAIIMILCSLNSYSQKNPTPTPTPTTKPVATVKNDTLYDDEEDPYKKFVGFGLVIGFNTIVESKTIINTNQTKPDSHEGIFAIGGSAAIYALDYLYFSTTYIYSKDSKSFKDFPQFKPQIYQIIDFTIHGIANPHSRVQFFASAGPSLFFNALNSSNSNGQIVYAYSTKVGFNAAVGFSFNIPLKFGTFTVTPEWRICTPFGSYTTLDQNAASGLITSYSTTSFLSIPRVTILYYPKL